MLDNLPVSASTQNSFSREELTYIATIARIKLWNWFVDFDQSPDGDIYARLVPPWSDGSISAFLLERLDGMLVLTDRLSDAIQDIVITYPTVIEAMKAVLTTACGDTATTRT